MRPSSSLSAGFTLIELLIVLTISAVLASFAAPALSDWISRQNVQDAASDFHQALSLARNEARARGENIGVVPRDGETWNSGWEVHRVEDSGNELLMQYSAPTETQLDIDFSSGWGNRIIFLPGGFARGADGVSLLRGQVRFSAGHHERSVCLSALGMVRSVRSRTCREP
ncbi:MAG: GspH/FimT family pseudopilin [Burkholderiaceae bacterium]